MKTKATLPSQLISVLIFLCVGALAFAGSEKVTYAGGDGSSFEAAVLIKGATEQTGVHAEYEYIRKHFPGAKTGKQSLQGEKGRTFDVIEIITGAGKRKEIYFDITEFFGK